ncbi:hypothetical protein [Saccharothrix sp.]|uniref:hypothetical protein n=1 Tax=Saccharothrix sp. TaxID=1873460 RepID=UPI002811AAEA|nr:hypothetical protein [Saccharothrix sp.]
MARTLRSFSARFRVVEQRLADVVRRGVSDDRAAYFADVVAAHVAMADLYREARDAAVGDIGGIVWSALYDAEQVHRAEARELERFAAKVALSDAAGTAA